MPEVAGGAVTAGCDFVLLDENWCSNLTSGSYIVNEIHIRGHVNSWIPRHKAFDMSMRPAGVEG